MKPRTFREAALHLVVKPQCALSATRVLSGVKRGKIGMSGHLIVDFRIVLHRTTAQWVKTGVYAKIIVAHVGVVARGRQFIDFGKEGFGLTAQGGGQLVKGVLRIGRLRQRIAYLTGL